MACCRAQSAGGDAHRGHHVAAGRPVLSPAGSAGRRGAADLPGSESAGAADRRRAEHQAGGAAAGTVLIPSARQSVNNQQGQAESLCGNSTA